jgi:hypothetical protein
VECVCLGRLAGRWQSTEPRWGRWAGRWRVVAVGPTAEHRQDRQLDGLPRQQLDHRAGDRRRGRLPPLRPRRLAQTSRERPRLASRQRVTHGRLCAIPIAETRSPTPASAAGECDRPRRPVCGRVGSGRLRGAAGIAEFGRMWPSPLARETGRAGPAKATNADEKSRQFSAVDLSADERGHPGDCERDYPVFWSVDEALGDQRGTRWTQARWLSG